MAKKGEGKENQYERIVAKRVFAHELRDAVPVEKTGNDQYEPKYVLTKLGEKVNRVFICGVITEREDIGKDGSNIFIRARVADPTGAFIVCAGQYQPEVREVLGRVNVPAFVAIVGKVTTYSPPESTSVFVNIRPERISVIDEATRDRWVKETADLTMVRIKASKASPKTKEPYEAMVQAAVKSVSNAS